jgi:hypothetical protein
MIEPAWCDASSVYQLRGGMLGRSKRFVFADRTGLFSQKKREEILVSKLNKLVQEEHASFAYLPYRPLAIW